MPLSENSQCFGSGDRPGRSPGADVRRLQMPKGSVADSGENHVGATLADHNLDGAPAVQRFIFLKREIRIVCVRDHNPFSFAEM